MTRGDRRFVPYPSEKQLKIADKKLNELEVITGRKLSLEDRSIWIKKFCGYDIAVLDTLDKYSGPLNDKVFAHLEMHADLLSRVRSSPAFESKSGKGTPEPTASPELVTEAIRYFMTVMRMPHSTPEQIADLRNYQRRRLVELHTKFPGANFDLALNKLEKMWEQRDALNLARKKENTDGECSSSTGQDIQPATKTDEQGRGSEPEVLGGNTPVQEGQG